MHFQKAWDRLAEVWGEAVIDHFPVIAEWRGGLKLPDTEMPSQKWLATHIRSSQNFLQVVKCSNADCCAPMTSALKSVLPHGFLPAPLSVTNIDDLKVDEAAATFLPLFQRLSVHLPPVGLDCLPYDFCCLSVKSYITNRMCNICQLYFPSYAMVAEHKRQLHPALHPRPVRIAAKHQRELMAIIVAFCCSHIITIYIRLIIDYTCQKVLILFVLSA